MSAGVQETLRIATPEGVSLELPLAGLGSRFVALLVDFVLQGLAFTLLIVVLVVANAGGYAATAIVAVAVFALLFAYPVAFELGAGGRTPGKRWSNLRVVCDDGSPVTFRGSALRNVLRLVDILPGLYLVGAVAIFATRANQRLGDLAAGTYVVRAPRPQLDYFSLRTVTPLGDGRSIETRALPGEMQRLVREFVAREARLAPKDRARVAKQIADRIRPYALDIAVNASASDGDDVEFLRAVARSMRASGGER